MTNATDMMKMTMSVIQSIAVSQPMIMTKTLISICINVCSESKMKIMTPGVDSLVDELISSA
uniref:Uncharacterized protein n=1 Tax=Oryza sativa subsp. japonica TaxID=39947 RepID=Q64M81_ORYSJ|nr:hypothetical protein [Oryza sativa Japonica Group]